MKIITLLLLTVITLTAGSCMKKPPMISFSGVLYTQHGTIMKNIPITFITDVNHTENSRITSTTDANGRFSFSSEMPSKKPMGIECFTDSGSYKRYNLTKEDISALSYTFTLQ